jgi:hypothetical protein
MLSPLTSNGVQTSVYGHAAYLQWQNAAGQTVSFFPDLVISENWSNDAKATEHPVEQGSNVIDHVRVDLAKCTLKIFATNEPIGVSATGADPGGPQSTALGPFPEPSTSAGVASSVTAQVWNDQQLLRGAFLAAGDLAATAAAAALGNGIGGAIAGEATILGLGALETLLTPYAESVQVPVTLQDTSPTTIVSASAQVQSFPSGATIGGSGGTDFVTDQIATLLFIKNFPPPSAIAVFGSKQTMSSMVIETLSYSRDEGTGTGAEITIGLKEFRIVSTMTVPVPALPSGAPAVAKGNQNPQTAPPQTQLRSLEVAIGQYAGLVGPTPALPTPPPAP